MFARIVSTAVTGITTQHIMSAIAQTIASKGVNVSEIDSLTSRIQRLDSAVDFWNGWYIAFVAMTVIFGACLFFVQFMSIKRSTERASAQTRLDQLKDEANRMALASVQGEAAKATERAAQAELKTEQERLERVKLEQRVNWRRLSSTQATSLCEALKPRFTNRLSISAFPDPEALNLATELSKVLKDCGVHSGGWGVRAGMIGPPIGILLRAAESSKTDVLILRRALDKNGLVVGGVEYVPKGWGPGIIEIEIHGKP